MTDQFEGFTFEPEETRSRRRGVAIFGTVAALATVAAAYAGVAYWSGERVPQGTTVAGVKVGGMTPSEAKAALQAGTAGLASAPVTLKAGDKQAVINPPDAGLSVDLDGSVAGLAGFTLNPVHVFSRLTGGSERELSTTVDDGKLKAALTEAGKLLAVPAKEGALTIAEGKAVVAAPANGSTLDVDAAASTISKSWPLTAPVEAPMSPVTPRVSADELDRAKTELADKAMSAPIVIKAGDKSFEVSAAALASALSFPADDKGTISMKLDAKAAEKIVQDTAHEAKVTQEAKDADVEFADGQPKVIPAQVGTAIDTSKVPDQITTALSSDKRTIEVPTTVTQPKFSTERAQATIPAGQISTFTSNFDPGGGGRVQNIRRAAEVLNNTYVRPGERFSLNGVLGQRTREKGYTEGGVIINSRFRKGVGGGISQVSTTVFNAAYFAGMDMVEYMAHGLYIDRYPVGREATISWPKPDNAWVNTTDEAVLVKASSTPGSVTVSIYGKKKYDVESVTGQRHNFRNPGTQRISGPDCINQSPAPGFDITVTRTLKQGGKVVNTRNFNTTYVPQDRVICTG